MICQKRWPPGGQGLFSLYIYIENFKNLLIRNHWTDFNITWQKCFLGDPLPRLFAIMICQKNMAAWGQGLFSLYICIENFKNLLVRNDWTDFNITWQKYFLGDPFTKIVQAVMICQKTWPLGGGVYFPYISI